MLKWAILCFSRLKPLTTLLIIIRKSRYYVCLYSTENFFGEILGNDSDEVLALQVTEKLASSDLTVLTNSVTAGIKGSC